MDGVSAIHSPKKLSLPRDAIMKTIKEKLPANVRIAKDTRVLFEECCIEFINMLSFESNEISKGRLINPTNVLEALQTLGFEEYIGEVQAAYNEHQIKVKDLKEKKKKRKLIEEGISEEEAIATQQKLFAEARARMDMNVDSASGLAIQATTHDDDEENSDYDDEEEATNDD